jgi:glycerate kinase
MTRVLLAFDKFKDALTASMAGDVVATALRELHPDWTFDQAPLADGGEGFTEILTQSAAGELVTCLVTGPRGEKVSAAYGLVHLTKIPRAARQQLKLPDQPSAGAKVAVIEMATASGLALLAMEQRDPWKTTTLGTGELMRHATEAGAVAILLGVGGSATNDLGLGALAALGFGFKENNGSLIASPIPATWSRLVKIDGAMRVALPPIFIACDVTNPLLGARGAAAVYGPQKGLAPADHPRIEAESARLAELLGAECGQPASLKDAPGAGAAGGIAFGLMTAANAKLLPGFELVSAWLDLETKLALADIVITGEGRFDESSLEGKGPGAVAARALALGKAVHVFAGQVTATTRNGLSLHAITPAGTPLPQALRDTAANLTAQAYRVFPQTISL